ncbi:fidgetin-like protein 1 isoform X2 [Lampetra fluviatilis]
MACRIPAEQVLAAWQQQHVATACPSDGAARRADARRGHLRLLHVGLAAGALAESAAARLFGEHANRYAAVLDAPDDRNGLNNYAESALQLAAGPAGESDRWRSALGSDGVFQLECVKAFVSASDGTRDGRDTSRVEDCVAGSTGAPEHRRPRDPTTSTLAPTGPSPCSTDTKTFVAGAVCSDSCKEDGASVVNAEAPSSLLPGLYKQAPRLPAFPFHNPTLWINQAAATTATSAAMKRKGLYVFNEDNGGAHPGGSSTCNPNSSHAENERVTDCDASGPISSNSFKSARQQLAIEQQKKYCNQNRACAPQASAKKSLGTSKPRGPYGKFVSPVLREDGSESTGQCTRGQNGEPSEIIDERLKNIDPKMVELINNEVMDHGPPVSWDDIAGLDFAKATIKEIVVWPMLRPDIFTGLRGPPKGILLFGPPGTGKTLIGKCIASQSGATFFSISASCLTSKWVGEGEKMVRALFAVARCRQPSVIFIDEIDSLLSQRADGEHDSSRRIKTEFLVQLDGATTARDERVLLVGATNRPQEIDEAARRRLAKRLYVPLPDAAARRCLLERLLAPQSWQLSAEELAAVVERSEGFSGADVTQLCREAALGPIRAVPDITTVDALQVRPILIQDFAQALQVVRPSVSPRDLDLYVEWNRTFGCGQ